MSCILVTGASGIIGVNVVRQLLERDVRVVAYDQRSPVGFLGDVLDRFESVQGDLLDLPWLMETLMKHGVTHIVHLGAVMSAHHVTHPYQLSRINLEGTLNVLEAAKLCRVRRVVFGSTRGVIARTEGTPHGAPHYQPVPVGFTGPRIPLTILKVAAEQLGLCYARQGAVDFCALRFADFFGAERIAKPERSQASVFDDVLRNAYFGTGSSLQQGSDQVFEPLYIKDCARGVVAACFASELRERIYHIGMGTGMTFGDAVGHVAKRFPSVHVQVGPGMNFAAFEKDPNYCVLDISGAAADLKYAPAYDLRAGIEDYVETMDHYVARGVVPPRGAE